MKNKKEIIITSTKKHYNLSKKHVKVFFNYVLRNNIYVFFLHFETVLF